MNQKKQVGEKAASFVQNNMTVGLGRHQKLALKNMLLNEKSQD